MSLIPSSSWSETSPAGGDNLSAGDNRIREMKTQIREVIDVDHDFPSSGQAADVGQHKKVTLQEQADLGTGAEGVPILGAQTVSGKAELVFTDEDDNDIQLTKGGVAYPSQSTVLADWSKIMELIYPVGSVVTLGVSTNPGTLFGVGAWTAIAGRVIVGIDSTQAEFDTLNETGGSPTNSHTHGAGSYVVPDSVYNKGTGSSGQIALSHPDIMLYNKMSDFAVSGTSATPSDTSNLQPYIVKYVWERTA